MPRKLFRLKLNFNLLFFFAPLSYKVTSHHTTVTHRFCKNRRFFLNIPPQWRKSILQRFGSSYHIVPITWICISIFSKGVIWSNTKCSMHYKGITRQTIIFFLKHFPEGIALSFISTLHRPNREYRGTEINCDSKIKNASTRAPKFNVPQFQTQNK